MKQVFRVTRTQVQTYDPDPINYDKSNRNSVKAMLQQDIRDLQRETDDESYVDFEVLPETCGKEGTYTEAETSFKFELVTLDDQGKEVHVEEYDKDGNVVPAVTRGTASIPHGGRVLTIREVSDDEDALAAYQETA